jgi:hypothetical protein
MTTIATEHVLYRIPEAMAALAMSRSVIYEQIRAGRLHTVTVGRRRYVTQTGIADYVALLEQEAKADGGAA